MGCVFGYFSFMITVMAFRTFFRKAPVEQEARKVISSGLGSVVTDAPSQLIQDAADAQRGPPTTTPKAAGPEDDIHIVFTSGCNLFQHWQAEVIFASHLKVGQPGRITRIVSGCTAEDKGGIKFRSHPGGLADETVKKDDLFKSTNPNAYIHIAPDFEGAENFPWINKPLGIEHWIRNAQPPISESVIVIIDSDMVFQDKLVLGKHYIDFENGLATSKGGLLCNSGCPGGRFKGEAAQGKTDLVKEGSPIGQMYGIGAQWVGGKYDLNAICGADSPAKKVTTEQALQYYTVGPPLILHKNDLSKLAPLWAEYMLKVVDKNNYDILADMYAYSIAAAHLNLPHLVLDNYMVSNAKYPDGEAWALERSWNDEFKQKAECRNPWPDSSDGKSHLPTFIHLCQTYEADGWSYHKGRVPANIFRCDLPLLKYPPNDLISRQGRGSEKERHARMICASTNAVNDAVIKYRSKYCPPQPFNEEATIKILSHHLKCEGKNEQGDDFMKGENCWDMAKIEK